MHSTSGYFVWIEIKAISAPALSSEQRGQTIINCHRPTDIAPLIDAVKS